MPPKTVQHPTELLPFLFDAWPEVKKTKVRQWLKFGAVRVNGKAVTRFNHPLKSGDTVAILPEKPSPSASLLPPGIHVVFEDEAIIVIEKPAHLLTVGTETEREATAFAYLTDYVRGLYGRSKARVWIVHRLDRETSGLVVFARTEETKEAMQKNWDQADKKYLAVTEGTPKSDEGVLISHLDESQPHKVFSAQPSEKTREARTHYRVLKRGMGRCLVELTLETGRRNQIRVQMADIGCPVVGDEKYGAKTNPARRVALHACWLRFQHPITGAEMHFESPLPPSLARLV